MASFKDKLLIEQDKFQTLSIDFDKALSRYIMIASGGSIAFIVNKFEFIKKPDLQICYLEMALWLFTIAIMLSGICLFLNARLASKYASSYSYLYGLLEHQEREHSDAEPYYYGADKKFINQSKAKVKPLETGRKTVLGLQILSSTIFAAGFLIAISLVTAAI